MPMSSIFSNGAPPARTKSSRTRAIAALAASVSLTALSALGGHAQAQERPNIVMLMTDDTGWNDFDAYSGGGIALGHPIGRGGG